MARAFDEAIPVSSLRANLEGVSNIGDGHVAGPELIYLHIEEVSESAIECATSDMTYIVLRVEERSQNHVPSGCCSSFGAK